MPPPRPTSKRRRTIAGEPPPGLFPAREDLLRLLAVLTIAAAAATVCSLLNRRPQPFCDSLQSIHASDYFDGYDSCEPCPQNGRCVDGELECIQGFKRYGRTCVEDGLLSQTAIKIVLSFPASTPAPAPFFFFGRRSCTDALPCRLSSLQIKSELLQRRICVQQARALCGKPAKTMFQMHDISNMVDHLLSKNSAGLTEDGIKLVKARVLESLQGLLDTSLVFDKVEAFKCPELVAQFHVTMACRMRQWIVRNIISVTTFCILFAALLWMLWSIYHKRTLSNRAEQIYEQVCEILEDNATNCKMGNSECDPWVVASWLRDHLLVPQERKNTLLWKKVEELILEDSRIDQYPKVVKGESKVVYEWQASGSLSAKMKKVQGSRGKSRTGTGTIKVVEPVGEVWEHGSCDSIPRDKTNA